MKKLLPIFIGCFMSFFAQAQTPMIGIGSEGISGLPDEVYVNQQVSFRVHLQNKGVVDVNGNVNVFAATVQGQNLTYIGATSINVGTLNSGDTISTQISVPIDTGAVQFAMGGNTVVVWPAAMGVQTTDSITKLINIILPPDTIGFNDDMGFQFPDTAKYGTTDSIIFYIENKRNSAYNGTIELWHQVIPDSMGGIITKVDTTTLNNITLAAKESRRVAMPQTFENPQYRMGGNTVVVWPAGVDMETADTATGRVSVVLINAIDNPTWLGAETVKIYPNPSQDIVTLSYASKLKLKQAIVINSIGQQVGVLAENQLNISHLPSGTYFIRVEFVGDKVSTFQLIKD